MDPKGNENFLFPRNLQKGLCFSGVRAESMSAGVSLDLPCSAQVAELTTKMEVPAVSLESGLSPRDPQEFSLSQLASGGSKPLGLTLSSTQHFTSPSHLFWKIQPSSPNKLFTQLFLAELDC